MGEYADMAIEQGFNDYIDSIDRYYNGYDDEEPPEFPSYHRTIAKAKPSSSIKEFPEGDSVLLRCQYHGSFLNRVCIIVKKTEKAILFKVDREVEDDITHDIIFWLPKSVMYMKPEQKKVYWLQKWATIKNICKE